MPVKTQPKVEPKVEPKAPDIDTDRRLYPDRLCPKQKEDLTKRIRET